MQQAWRLDDVDEERALASVLEALGRVRAVDAIHVAVDHCVPRRHGATQEVELELDDGLVLVEHRADRNALLVHGVAFSD